MNPGAEEPPETVGTTLLVGATIEFETGALSESGGDLTLDAAGNVATDALADLGRGELADIESLPPATYVTAAGAEVNGSTSSNLRLSRLPPAGRW